MLLGFNTLRTIKRDAVGRVTDLPTEVTESPLVTEIDTSMINICEVSPRAMDRYQISLREIIGAVKARNIRLTGGASHAGPGRLPVHYRERHQRASADQGSRKISHPGSAKLYHLKKSKEGSCETI